MSTYIISSCIYNKYYTTLCNIIQHYITLDAKLNPGTIVDACAPRSASPQASKRPMSSMAMIPNLAR